MSVVDAPRFALAVLNLQHRWLQRVRLWRLILSQSPEGWWDATSTTAFALEARPATETAVLPKTWLSRLMFMASATAEEAVGTGNAVDALQGHRGGDVYDDIAEATHSVARNADDDTLPVADAAAEATRSEALTKEQLASAAGAPKIIMDWCVRCVHMRCNAARLTPRPPTNLRNVGPGAAR